MADRRTRQTRSVTRAMRGQATFTDAAHYDRLRAKLIGKEREMAFDHHMQTTKTANEDKAQAMLKAIRSDDWLKLYKPATYPNGDRRYPGEPYLQNLDIISQTRLLGAMKDMPKGAHLHIHYNACLPPDFLIKHAKTNPHMYIWSDRSLATQAGKDAAEVRFQVLSPPASSDILRPEYPAQRAPNPNSWMRYSDFLAGFPGGQDAAEAWLISKVIFTEDQVYGIRRTVNGVWTQFAINTRFMKGLFGYEDAFRAYTRALIRDFVDDGILYAELRPTFPANVMSCDNPTDGTITNHAFCQIILDEVQGVIDNLADGEFFHGVKIIYCAPKVPRQIMNITNSMAECIALKQAYPNLICGFDLVGPEEGLETIHYFLPKLLQFKADCKTANIDIPFLFHAGETIWHGSVVDENLFDALMLGSKRIGHGFALASHPLLMDLFKERGICLEICPIGNEMLHLTRSIRGHAMWTLLANNVPCTINCDNAAFYSSSLSHDFYQTMIGSENMSLSGLKQLTQWSIDHSCLQQAEKRIVQAEFDRRWSAWIDAFIADPRNAQEAADYDNGVIS